MCENVGKRFRTSSLRTHFSLYLIPSVLIMALSLSATLPPSLEFLVIHVTLVSESRILASELSNYFLLSK